MRKINTAYFLLAVFILPVFSSLHNTWDKLLRKYVEDGRVDYAGLKSNHKDLAKLDEYLKSLGGVNLTNYTDKGRLAFWINAYNAFTVKLILNNYPIQSIKNIKKPWKQKSWFAAGEKLSLDDMEHKKLRAQLKDYRIHFAIVCASVGCPDLKNRAYQERSIDRQLDDAAEKFFEAKKNFVIDKSGASNIVYLSKIFKWFSSDFGNSNEHKLSYISRFLSKKDSSLINSLMGVRVKYLDYDWSLNDKVR